MPQLSRRAFFLSLAVSLVALRPTRFALAQIEEGAVAAFLAQQALSFAAGKISENAFGQPKIGDVRTWINDAVAELKAYVSALIAQNEIDHMIAAADGFNQNLLQYAGLLPVNRAQNVYLIQDADLRTTELLDLSVRYDQTFTVFLTAMSFQLIARQALFNLDHDPAHLLSIKMQVDNFFIAATAAFKKIQLRVAPGQRIGACCIYTPLHGGQYSCRPAIDRNVLEGDDYIRSGEKSYAVNGAARFAHDQHYPRMQKVFQKFQSDSISAMGSIAKAYETMSSAAGRPYAPPVPIPSVLPDIPPNPPPRIWLTHDWKNCQ